MEEPVLETCTSTLVTRKKCLQLTKHRKFAGCEKDFVCF